ncbi:putative SGT1-domain-containing protein [Lyophyllum shimeji]|uniref:SGT1-domain-containing protein n=1 Tax=Lyophyllum shimeji TaxID=47721 RepID=A0A9P3UKJ0_LYOSH|nr:putative SGT1-domain-containing protein [Lyophyllum shimeji]
MSTFSSGISSSMDIFNRPPAIAEDTLQYTLYPPKNLSDKASVTTFAAYIRTYADTVLPGFIWHRDAFELKVAVNPEPDIGAYMLEGRMRVGDSVDDEWCTVWLLREISAKWDLVISVFDSDGEFLLIEAADALPSWVKPTNSENRVWIYSSRLHLVPISHVSPPSRKRLRRQLPGAQEDEDRDMTSIEDDDEFLAAQDAVELVRDPSVETLAPVAVEKLVWQRVSQYPAAARNHVHHTKAYVPTDIAIALTKNPSLVQKAVESFYTRDAIQLRAAHRMNRFPPSSSVLSTVKMTRTAYAQLVGQKFFPPKVFGTWQEAEGTKEWRWRDVGMKIAVGFEMLYHESKNRSDVAAATGDAIKSSTEAKKDALRRNPEYIKYIQNLVSADYFRGEIEGSELWRSLESNAADMFVEARREDDATRPSFASQVNAAVWDTSQPLSIPPIEEDPDDWLNIDAQNFDAMLEQTMGKSKSTSSADAMDVDKPQDEISAEDRLASTQAAKLKELAAKVESFVEGEGDIEGARIEGDTFSDEEFSDEEPMSDRDDEEAADSAARKAAMDRLVPALDPADYGKMPASFHSNSQRVSATTVATEVVEETTKPASGVDGKPSTDDKPRVKPIRPPLLPRDEYEGVVDSDDETDEEAEDEESEEERPQVVGDIEIDMGEEEEEFLEFSRQALGITDEQWSGIVRDRQKNGAFVPASATEGAAVKSASAKKTTSSTSTTAAVSTAEKQPTGTTPASGPRRNVNPNLDSFEAVMRAMDEELARIRPAAKTAAAPVDAGKGKAKAIVEDEHEDIESAMDAELKAALAREGEEDEADEDEEAPDYNLIKNFLESFKSQAGLSGPVSNLAGMLQPGWHLPRDEL